MIFLLPFLIAFAASLILTPLMIRLAKVLGFVDDPRTHKHPAILHRTVVPRAGGLAIFLAFFLALVLSVSFSKQILGIVVGGLILLIVGLVDDKKTVKSWVRIVAQITAALVVVGSGVGISFITNPFFSLGGPFSTLGEVLRLDTLRIAYDFFGWHSVVVWADIFALFWIVWVINMVNFSSGVDGQMPGIVFITLMVIFVASLRFFPDQDQLVVSELALAGAGATLGFLFFNFYPAKIFPGDSGSYFLGFLVAVVAILSGAKVGTAILVMAVPLSDGVFTILRRIALRKSPFVGDRSHLHHRLLELGWGHRRIALFYWLVCAILGATALSLNSAGKLFAGMVVVIVIAGGLLWLNTNLPQKAQK